MQAICGCSDLGATEMLLEMKETHMPPEGKGLVEITASDGTGAFGRHSYPAIRGDTEKRGFEETVR